MEYLGNAFSLQMLEDYNATIKIEEIAPEKVASTAKSIIGHQQIVDILKNMQEIKCAVELNRASIKLDKESVLYVVQYIGGRLPEGATKIPSNEFKFLRIQVI